MALNNIALLTFARVAFACLLVAWSPVVADEAVTPDELTPPPKLTVEPPAADANADQVAYPCHGDFTLQYRVRWTKDVSDQDLFQYLNVDVGDPRANLLTGHLSMRSTWDIDGRSRVTGYYTFDSLADTYDQSFNAQLYSAYVDVNRMGVINLFRLGRQVLTDLPVTLQFDGGRLETWKFKQLRNLQLGFFGGVPVHLYESSSAGDSLYGAYAKCEPWSGARLQVDWTHLDDDYLSIDRRNEYYGIGLWQRVLQDFQLYGRYNRLDDQDRDLEFRVIYASQPLELIVNASYYALLEKQNNLSTDIDPFTTALLTLYPYWQARLSVQKSFATYFDLVAGGTARQVFDVDDLSPYNREFATAFATLSATDWLLKGLQADLTWEVYDAHKFGGTTQTVSGDVGYTHRREIAEGRFQDVCSLQAGTTYSLYKYDFFLAQEVVRTRTWYVKAWYKPATWAKWEARFEHESSEAGEYSLFSTSIRLQY